MSDGGGGSDGFVFFSGTAGCSQAHDPVFNQFRKISSTLLVAKRNVVEFFALFDLQQPVFDDIVGTTAQYCSHSFLIRPGGGFASCLTNVAMYWRWWAMCMWFLSQALTEGLVLARVDICSILNCSLYLADVCQTDP
jgi:hypothetical protein